VLSSPDVADAFGRAGRQRAVEQFSLHAAGKRFLDVYDQLLCS